MKRKNRKFFNRLIEVETLIYVVKKLLIIKQISTSYGEEFESRNGEGK